MQRQTNNESAYWQPLPVEFMKTHDTPLNNTKPIMGEGYACFYIARPDAEGTRDRIPRIFCNFLNAKEENYHQTQAEIDAGDRRYLEDCITFAGIALTGESTGNPLMVVTNQYWGFVPYRNTSNERHEAGDELYWIYPYLQIQSGWKENEQQDGSKTLTPTYRKECVFASDSEIVPKERNGQQVAIIVRKHTFRRVVENKMQYLVDPGAWERWSVAYKQRHFVGRCMLSCEPGHVGQVLLR